VLTPGGGLRAPYLLHLVVQSSEEPVSAANVRRALALGLERVVDWGLSSLALPPLGTGAGALEPEDAARLLAEALREHERMGRAPLDVLVVVETEYERDVFARVLGEPAPPPG
jgi:O-acetyl-ADP-ribose deacetylase (regulator of RNase III)